MSPVLPLEEFPAEMRERIDALANADEKPPRWIKVFGAEIPSRAWYEWHIRRGINPARGRNKLRPAAREMVIQRDGLICGLCGGEVMRDDVHIDHILPVARGGHDGLDNLQVAHSLCNMRKGARA